MKFNKLIPELSVSDFEKSLAFYKTTLGFKVEYTREEPKFAFISLNGSQIMIEQVKSESDWNVGELNYPFGRGVNFQIEVKNIEPLLSALKAKNYPISIEPKENWYRQNNRLLGNKEFLVKDPDGYLLRFFENLGAKNIQK